MEKNVNVLIVDDHPMIIESYVAIISTILHKHNLKFEKATTCEVAYNSIENFINKKQVIDFAILDLSLPPYQIKKVLSGLDLGILIQTTFPKCKIIVITHYTDGFLLNKVFKSLKPQGFLNKADIDNTTFSKFMDDVLNGKTFLSETINKSIIEFNEANFKLDEIDFEILDLIEKGFKTKELPNYIDLSLSAIEKRKAKIKFYLTGQNVNDSEMIKTRKMLKFS
jgi:DNA-binding NarL/FixJ family response regulator